MAAHGIHSFSFCFSYLGSNWKWKSIGIRIWDGIRLGNDKWILGFKWLDHFIHLYFLTVLLLFFCLIVEEREIQKNYWIEHSADLTLEAMMLDSKASDLDKEERPEVPCSSLFCIYGLALWLPCMLRSSILLVSHLLFACSRSILIFASLK